MKTNHGAMRACMAAGAAATITAMLMALPARAADLAVIKAAVARASAGQVVPDEVRETPIAGLVEVRVGAEIMYTDANGRYALVEGRLVDLVTKRDLTQARLDEIKALPFATLPLQHAIKITRGKGTRVVAVFEDPECTYCQKVHRFLAAQPDITIYAFPVPTTSSRPLAESAWCAKDRAAAWNTLMTQGQAAGAGGCATSIDAVVDWARTRGITATPVLVFADGSRVEGAPDPRELLARLESSRSKP